MLEGETQTPPPMSMLINSAIFAVSRQHSGNWVDSLRIRVLFRTMRRFDSYFIDFSDPDHEVICLRSVILIPGDHTESQSSTLVKLLMTNSRLQVC